MCVFLVLSIETKKKHARGFTCDVLFSSAVVVQPNSNFLYFFFHNKNDGVGMTLNFTFFFRGDEEHRAKE